jgi:hypothetical protein
MNPFNQAQTSAPVAGFNPFAGLGNAEIPASGRPRLPENFSYVVQIDDYKIHNNNVIVEYHVVESNNPSVQPGTQSSYVRSQTGKGWQGYFAKFVYCNMGIDPNDQGQINAARPVFDRCLAEALTKVADPSLPVHLIGNKMRVDVTPGKPAEPGKKYYPNEWYSAA